MFTIKFDHAVKFNGVRHTAHEAFQVEEKDIAELKKAGAIVLSADPEITDSTDSEKVAGEEVAEAEDGEEAEDNKDVAQLKEELLEYTVPQLIKFAEERGVDLQGKTRKADIYNIIIASLD